MPRRALGASCHASSAFCVQPKPLVTTSRQLPDADSFVIAQSLIRCSKDPGPGCRSAQVTLSMAVFEMNTLQLRRDCATHTAAPLRKDHARCRAFRHAVRDRSCNNVPVTCRCHHASPALQFQVQQSCILHPGAAAPGVRLIVMKELTRLPIAPQSSWLRRVISYTDTLKLVLCARACVTTEVHGHSSHL